MVWALLVIAALVAATELGLLDYRPGGDAYEILQQQIFGVVFAVAAAIAWRWRLVGGLVAGFAASALMIFAIQQLQPVHAALVVTAFAVPGVLWVVGALAGRSRRYVSMALGMAVAAVLAGGIVANGVYQELFGPSHPGSSARVVENDRVDWVWSGGVTSSSAVVNAKLTSEATRVRLAVSRDVDLREPRFGRAVAMGADRRVRLSVDELTAGTRYHYGIEIDGELGPSAGRLTTFPEGPSSFTLAAGACARVGSNGAVFDAIREADPLLYLVAGDFHYANIDEDDPAAFREIYDHTLTRPGQAALYRSTPLAYVWDDHDFGGDDANSLSASRPAAMSTYRENVPHYALAGPDAAIYQAFTVGRVRIIITDARSARSPSSQADDVDKTMLGAQQKAWFMRELAKANGNHEAIVWVNSVPWIGAARAEGDDWSGYATERRELADFVATNEITGLVMVSGDAHMLAIDDGTNSDYSTAGGAAFPILHAGALDRPGSTKGGPYSEGVIPGGGQFGLVRIDDRGGDAIEVGLSGLDWEGTELISHRFSIPVGAP